VFLNAAVSVLKQPSSWESINASPLRAATALLMSFALTMSIALGITAPLSYSVFTALGAALLLGAVAVPQVARSSARTHSTADFASSNLHDRTFT
jgi:hypothetical protein